MATLVLSAVGTLIGGPLGGAIGALVGRQVDNLILPRGNREGPRLTELAVTTSTYGASIPRHHGRMRVAGTVIWATNLIEQRDQQGGGKGQPSVTSYSYSMSFAVALSSRPLLAIGRIWADGKLLRGGAGDLKVGGTFRFHSGVAEQAIDPLMASAEQAGRCPAFRGIAYAVFEDLQLAEFGNRIPSLSFEVIGDTGPLSLTAVLGIAGSAASPALPLPGVEGLTCDGPPAALLEEWSALFPVDCDAAGDRLRVFAADAAAPPRQLGEPAAAAERAEQGAGSGAVVRRMQAPDHPLGIVRYYDLDRDYQPGAQRAAARAESQPRTVDLPAALTATAARRLIDVATRRIDWSRQTVLWRTAELDPAITPGTVVVAPGLPGRWKVQAWEWGTDGVELTLRRVVSPPGASAAGTPGRAAVALDAVATPTLIEAFELPWDGTGNGSVPIIHVAASSIGPGWTGAALFQETPDAALQPVGETGRLRAAIGVAATVLPPASAHFVDRSSTVDIVLVASDLELLDASLQQVLQGANRAMLGTELLQFCSATPIAPGRWRLSGLLRGRGGTEAAIGSHVPGERFVLLDGRTLALDPQRTGTIPGEAIVATGLADPGPVRSTIALRGATLRPLSPVHGRTAVEQDGTRHASWVRRARGAWVWRDEVDTPLNEQAELYRVEAVSGETILQTWLRGQTKLTIDAATAAQLLALDPQFRIRVRQVGDLAISDPLLF